MFISSARLLIATLWCGSLWTVGYIVAPTLFVILHDRALAGSIAGSLFRIEAWLSIVAGIVLIVSNKVQSEDANYNKRRLLLIAAMLVCTLIGYFGLHPFMAAFRGTAGPQFGILHAVSSVFYLLESLLGIGLILSLRRVN